MRAGSTRQDESGGARTAVTLAGSWFRVRCVGIQKRESSIVHLTGIERIQNFAEDAVWFREARKQDRSFTSSGEARNVKEGGFSTV